MNVLLSCQITGAYPLCLATYEEFPVYICQLVFFNLLYSFYSLPRDKRTIVSIAANDNINSIRYQQFSKLVAMQYTPGNGDLMFTLQILL